MKWINRMSNFNKLKNNIQIQEIRLFCMYKFQAHCIISGNQICIEKSTLKISSKNFHTD